MKVSKSFVIDADAVRTYDAARDFLTKLGYYEQNAIRPTLLVLKRKRVVRGSGSSKDKEYRINLRTSFNPVGNLQLYSTALVAIRCVYDVKVSGVPAASGDRTVFESEVERLQSHLVKLLHSPAITQSNVPPSATSSSEQKTVEQEGFEHAEVQASLIQNKTEIRMWEDINLKIHVENVGKKTVLLTRIEKLVPIGFQLVGKPENSSLEETHLILKEKSLVPREKLEIEIVLKPFGKGTFEIKPKIVFLDEDKHEMFTELEPRTYNVLERVLPGRVPTGYKELDSLLLGGIPENYSVLLTSSSNDKRELIIKKYLTVGAEAGQITFYITAEPGNGKVLAENFQSNFYLLVCNPQADLMIKNLPNVFKLSGVENLNEIGIALAKSFRRLDPSQSSPRRACIEIISDVLLEHHAIITRKWLSSLLPELKSKGFTTLAVVNPHMHPQEEVHAILDLFEGEIKITEKETVKGIEKFLRIGKLYNQRYLENELSLKRERQEP